MSRWLQAISKRSSYDSNNPNKQEEVTKAVKNGSQEAAYWMIRDKYITRADGELFYTLLRSCHLFNVVNLLFEKNLNKRDLEIAGFAPELITKLINKVKETSNDEPYVDIYRDDRFKDFS